MRTTFTEIKSKDVQVNISKELQNKITKWKKENTFYGIVNVVGDSMTCSDSKSIPNGSKIFISEINNFRDDIFNIPINKPLTIILEDKYNKQQTVCKTISCIDTVNYTIRLTSYNKKYKDVWFNFSSVKRLFKIEKVFSNDEVIKE